MNPRLRRRTAIVLALGAVIALVGGSATALAKEGVAVELTQLIPHDAPPGTTLTVGFAVTVETETGPSPVYGSPVFVRLIGPEGATSEGLGTEDRATPGLYRAEVVVPTGGIQSAEFGMRGSGTDAAGKTVRVDEMFELHGRLFSSTAATGAADLRVPLAIVLGACLIAALLLLAVHGRRGRSPMAPQLVGHDDPIAVAKLRELASQDCEPAVESR